MPKPVPTFDDMMEYRDTDRMFERSLRDMRRNKEFDPELVKMYMEHKKNRPKIDGFKSMPPKVNEAGFEVTPIPAPKPKPIPLRAALNSTFSL